MDWDLRTNTRAIAAIALAGMAMVACKRSGNSPASDARASQASRQPPAIPIGAWESLAASRGPSDPAPRALAEFAVLFGSIPGVQAPASDGSGPFCATHTINTLRAHWSSLTPEQQQAIERRIAPQPEVARAGFFQTPPRASPYSDDERRARYQGIVERMLAQLRARLNIRYDKPIDIVVSRDPHEPGFVHTRAFAEGANAPPPLPTFRVNFAAYSSASRCRLTVYGDLDWYSRQTQEMIIGHEVFHCVQYSQSDLSVEAFAALSDWRTEGSAAWAGESLVGGTQDSPYAWWSDYLRGQFASDPRRRAGSLRHAGYLGIGVFSHLSNYGVAVWSKVLSLTNSTYPSNDAAWIALIQGGRPDLLVNYASAPLRNSGFGDAWNTSGPGLRASSPGREPVAVTMPSLHAPLELPQNPEDWAATEMGTQWLYRVTLPADADFVTLQTAGAGRAIFERREDEATWSEVRSFGWCLRADGCQCPNGSAPAGVHLDRRASAGVPLTVAVTQDPSSGQLRPRLALVADSLARRCTEQPEAPPSDCRAMTGVVDPCLTRHRWVLRNNSAHGAYHAILQGVAGNSDIAIEQVSGRQVLRFSDRHESTLSNQRFNVTATASVTGLPERARSRIQFNGDAVACFSSDGGTLRSRLLRNDIRVNVETRVLGLTSGQQSARVPNEPVLFDNDPVRYQCSDAVLTLRRDAPTSFVLVFDPL